MLACMHGDSTRKMFRPTVVHALQPIREKLANARAMLDELLMGGHVGANDDGGDDDASDGVHDAHTM